MITAEEVEDAAVAKVEVVALVAARPEAEEVLLMAMVTARREGCHHMTRRTGLR